MQFCIKDRKVNALAEDIRTVSADGTDAVLRQYENQKKSYLSPKHYVAYILSGMGDTMWMTFSKKLFFFATQFLGISALTWGWAETASFIADTVDNAVSGLIIDRTRTRWGRVRPYIVLTLPFWVIGSLTHWVLPSGMSQPSLFVTFLIFNYIGSIARSFYDTSYQIILFNITPNPIERNRLIATDAYADLVGVWIPSLFSGVVVDFLPQIIGVGSRSVYTGGAIVFTICVIIFRTYGFFSLKERMPLSSREEMKKMSLGQTIKIIGTCRPMWALLAKNFFGVGKGTGTMVEDFFWLNCMGRLSYGTIAGLFTGLPSYFVLPFAPKLTKKFGLRNLAVGSYMFCGISYFIMWIVGYKPFGEDKFVLNLIWIIFALTVCGSLNSIQRYCGKALDGDLYDYVEWKSGIRNEATITAAMSYFKLISDAAAKMISAAAIAAIHYVPNIDANGIQIPQTDPGMLAGIWTVFALAPAIGRFMKGVSLMFFNVHGETRETMMLELAKIRATKESGMEELEN